MSTPAVSFDDVSIIFGPKPDAALAMADKGATREEIQVETDHILGVHGCSLDIAPGEIVVLMGLSGSGKSTLLRAVNALNPVSRGRVLVQSGDKTVDVAKASGRVLRRLRRTAVGMVFQQFGLLPWRTVAENVGFGLEVAGVSRGEREARVRTQLDLVGLGGRAEALVGELSGGMQQRVGLARAFATEAPILLMDEPFSALDPLIRARLQDELLDLQDRLKRTIIFVSHDLDEAFRLGSRISIMEGGRIVQTGTPRQILQAPANGYVSDFVAHLNPLRVLRVGDAARTEPPPEHAPEIAATATLDEAIRALDGVPALKVVGEGRAPATLSAADVLHALAPRDGSASGCDSPAHVAPESADVAPLPATAEPNRESSGQM
ncbi:MAG: ATP-binding cassette domain-containing protein [Pseudomonadota bacterium]